MTSDCAQSMRGSENFVYVHISVFMLNDIRHYLPIGCIDEITVDPF
jgi:hypothetical protein